ncbi:hypothetical protein [Bacillus alkalicellulosilyticus]|uniref:hypothetical protein n=1 Tax=Alkalihalobacterium alkalicellulosilyticum TaxID=1912214 RepID=UPI000996987F|nr:hypothetical protein [Bacillus alkalicellulosilyticus]
MTKDEVLQLIYERLGDGIYILIALKEGPLLKEQLWHNVNQLYKEKVKTDKDLIPSRYTLDIYTARLDAVGLVNIKEMGRGRLYSLSPFYQELASYIARQKNK